MKKTFTIKLLLGFLFLNLAFIANAQLNYLTGGFTTSASTYVDLGTNGDTIPVANKDDAFSAPIPIGFTFEFNNAPYDSFVFSTNGFIKLGRDSASRHFLFTTHAQPPANGPFTAGTSPTPALKDSSMLFAFGQDLFAGSSNAEFRVHTTGTTGSRVCTIQWKNVKDKIQAGAAQLYDTINFQIKLYESTNVIQYVYGKWTTTINSPTVRFAAVGIVGSSVTTAAQNLHLVKGSTIAWGSSVANAGFYLNNAVNYRNAISTPAGPAPDLGRTFTFTPITADDAGIRVIHAQGKVSLANNVADSIRTNIINNGVNTLTSLVVTLTISGAHSYTTTATIGSLAPGNNVTVAFAPFTPTNIGASVITVSVPSDDNNANNVLTNSYLVTNFDMSYRDTLIAHSGSNGITIPNFWGAKFFVTGPALVTTVRSFLVSNSDATGDTVCGMILDTLGNIIARSPNYIVQTSDLGTTLNFSMSMPPTITNRSIIAGIAGGTSINTLNYFLGTSQTEAPIRNPSPFYFLTTASAISNSTVGTLYATPGAVGNQTTRLMIECYTRPIPQIDVAVVSTGISARYNIPTGVNLPLRVVVRNTGAQTRTSGIAVRYRINNGAVIGPVNTTVSINPNDTTSVLFTGTSALNFSTAGTYNIKIYTSLTNDSIRGNDTLNVTYIASPQNVLPFRTTSANLNTNWTINNSSATASIWKTGNATLPNGSSNTCIYADNFNFGTNGRIVSTSSFNFTGVSNPTLYYSLAHAPKTVAAEDTFYVEVSTDGGNTFTVIDMLTGQSSNPSLGTMATQNTLFTPSSSANWRNATVSLASYANNPYVLVAFRSVSGFGNSIYLNNINIANPAIFSSQSVTSASSFFSGIASASFNSSIGASNGVISFSRFSAAPVFSAASPVFATNFSQTTPNSAVFTPDVISPSAWFSIHYSGIGTGNLPSSAPFDINLNISTIGAIQSPDSLYIVRRTESTGSWTALNTARVGNILSSSGLTAFGDFGIASVSSVNVLPVKWLGFNATKINENLVQLNWSTAAEVNNKGFEIETSFNGVDFKNIGFVNGVGNSNKKSNYTFNDNNASISNTGIYYRLKQFDFDGAFNYSNIIKVNTNNNLFEETVEVSPNPFVNEINIKLNTLASNNVKIQIYNVDGKLEVERNYLVNVGLNNIELNDISNLPKGLYVLKVNQNGVSKSFKLIK